MLAGVASLALAPAAVLAQESGDVQLEEVVVTAERTVSTVQRTPIAITAIGGEELVRQGVRDAQDLSGKVPNVNIANNVGTMTVTIRGVGTSYDNQSAEPAVNVNVDGVYFARAASAAGAMFDIERIEALRGPQGTLYGRNSTGGSLNIITKKPTQKFEGQVEADLGNYDSRRFFGMFNLPVIEDKLALRLAFQTNKRDGYTDNAPATDYNDADDIALRVHALFTPSEKWSVLVSADYGHYGGVGPNHITSQDISTNKFKSPMDTDGRRNTPIWGASVQFNADVGLADMTYIAAYRSFRRDQIFDNDYINTPATTRDNYAVYNWENSNWSHELRFASKPTNERLKWVAGAFYYSEKNNFQYTTYNSSATTNSSCFCNHDTGGKSYALFGQATYKLTETLGLTGGLRYTRDTKFENGRTIITPTTGAQTIITNTADLKWDNVSGKVGVEWQVAPASLLYGSVSNGYKSGGYYDGLNSTYKPEKLTAFEIGSKNRFFDSRLQINIAAFYYDYKDFQAVYVATLPVINARVAATGNAKKARSKGVEVEGTYLLTQDDRFEFSVSRLEARFIDFLLNSVPPQNFSNSDMPRSPDWSLSAGYTHTWRLGNGARISARARSYYQTGTWLTFQHLNGSYQKEYTRTDADLTYDSADGRWYGSAYIRNIENAVVGGNAVAGAAGSAFAALDLLPPRVYGLRVGARF
jgi:iron complex outermembrane receptor protein